MPSLQELTRRIKSVKSTRKITRAMQLVSSAKMRKSQLAAISGRDYSSLAWQLISSLNGVETQESLLLQQNPEAKKVGVLLVTTNKGLVGAFNTNLLKKVLKEVRSEGGELEIITIGKKGAEGMTRLKQNLIANFQKLDTTVPIKEIYPVAKFISKLYEGGEYQKIYIVYNKFVSMISQEPTSKQLLPLVKPSSAGIDKDIIFEPSPKEVLNQLLPRIVEAQIYQALLESDAAEHSARMMMMKNATDNAGDLVDDLTLTFNQLRQNKITTELSEITAGKIALE